MESDALTVLRDAKWGLGSDKVIIIITHSPQRALKAIGWCSLQLQAPGSDIKPFYFLIRFVFY